MKKLDVIVNNNDDDCIDDIVSDLQKIFVNTAKSTVGYMSNEQRSTDHNNNPWFGNTCKEKRDEFHIVRNRYRFDKSDRTKEGLNLKAKALRGQMNSSFKKFQKNNAPTFVRPQKMIQRKCGRRISISLACFRILSCSSKFCVYRNIIPVYHE